MENSIVPFDLSDTLTQEVIFNHPDIFANLEYFLLKDQNKSMDEITDHLYLKYPNLPSTRPGLYYRLDKWKQDGTWRLAEKL